EKTCGFSHGMNRIAVRRQAAGAARSHLTTLMYCGTLHQHLNKDHRFAGLPRIGLGVKPMPFVTHKAPLAANGSVPLRPQRDCHPLGGHGHPTVSPLTFTFLPWGTRKVTLGES